MRPFWRRLLAKVGHLRLPGFPTVRLGTVLLLFWENLTHPMFTIRGAAMAFSFFFALFPGLLFALMLISYLPFEDFERLFQQQLGQILPAPAYDLVHDVVFEGIYQKRNFTLLSVSLFLALYSLWQGMLTMLRAFFHEGLPKPPFWVLWLRALGLVGVLLLLILANLAFSFIRDHHLVAWIEALADSPLGPLFSPLVGVIKFLVLFGVVCIAVEVIYRAGLPRLQLPYWISPGAVLTTFLLGAAMKLLSWYFLAVANFSRFYGSIAAVIALMVWFYWLSLVLLVGFEVNYSLYRSVLLAASREK